MRHFLSTHPDFRPLPAAAIWEGAIGGVCPTSTEFLVLTPRRQGTDGFFVAVLERAAAAGEA